MAYFTTRDGCRLFYDIQGDRGTETGAEGEANAPTVVFLNGTAQTAVNWHPQVRALKDRFRVLTYDARAQGRSELGSTELTWQRHVNDLKALLADRSVSRAALVGMSHGAFIALAFAHQFPKRVNRVVLGGLGDAPSRRSRLYLRSWSEILVAGNLEMMFRSFIPTVFGEAFLREHERILSQIVAALVRRNNRDALLAHLNALAEYPPAARFTPTPDIPLLVLSGEEDLLAPPESGRRLAVRCGGEFERVIGTGHSLPSEAPARFSARIAAFLSG
jgi:pimeloyl-ACP methyl ester carboxylesterase